MIGMGVSDASCVFWSSPTEVHCRSQKATSRILDEWKASTLPVAWDYVGTRDEFVAIYFLFNRFWQDSSLLLSWQVQSHGSPNDFRNDLCRTPEWSVNSVGGNLSHVQHRRASARENIHPTTKIVVREFFCAKTHFSRRKESFAHQTSHESTRVLKAKSIFCCLSVNRLRQDLAHPIKLIFPTVIILGTCNTRPKILHSWHKAFKLRGIIR